MPVNLKIKSFSKIMQSDDENKYMNEDIKKWFMYEITAITIYGTLFSTIKLSCKK